MTFGVLVKDRLRAPIRSSRIERCGGCHQYQALQIMTAVSWGSRPFLSRSPSSSSSSSSSSPVSKEGVFGVLRCPNSVLRLRLRVEL